MAGKFFNYMGTGLKVSTALMTDDILGSANPGDNFSYALDTFDSGNPSVAITYTAKSPLPNGLFILNNTIYGTLQGAGPWFLVLQGSNGKVYNKEITKATGPSFTTQAGTTMTPSVPISIPLSAAGATSFTVSAGSLPAGLNLTGSTISGIPTKSGTFTIAAHNATGGITTRTFRIVVNPGAPVWNTPANLGSIYGGIYYNGVFAAKSSGSLVITMTGGSLPSGLTFNNNGTITGTPDYNFGTYEFTLRATNGGLYADQTFTLTTIDEVPVWVTNQGPLGTGVGYQSVSFTLAASDTDHGPNPLVYSILSGSLPLGLSLNTSTGVLSGTLQNTAGVYNFTLNVSDGYASSQASFSYIVLLANPVWSTSTNIGSYYNLDYISSSVYATDPGGTTLIYSIIGGALPNGLSLSGNNINGTISGTIPGTYNVSIRASNGSTYTDRTFSITVGDRAPIWTTQSGSLGVFVINTEESITLVATDADGEPAALTYSLVSGNFPSGISLNANTGVISGTTVDQIATYNFVIGVSDGLITTNQSFSIDVQMPTLSFTGSGVSVNSGSKYASATYSGASQTLTADGTMNLIINIWGAGGGTGGGAAGGGAAAGSLPVTLNAGDNLVLYVGQGGKHGSGAGGGGGGSFVYLNGTLILAAGGGGGGCSSGTDSSKISGSGTIAGQRGYLYNSNATNGDPGPNNGGGGVNGGSNGGQNPGGAGGSAGGNSGVGGYGGGAGGRGNGTSGGGGGGFSGGTSGDTGNGGGGGSYTITGGTLYAGTSFYSPDIAGYDGCGDGGQSGGAGNNGKVYIYWS